MTFTYYIANNKVSFCTFVTATYRQSSNYTDVPLEHTCLVASDQLSSPETMHNIFANSINYFCKGRYFE